MSFIFHTHLALFRLSVYFLLPTMTLQLDYYALLFLYVFCSCCSIVFFRNEAVFVIKILIKIQRILLISSKSVSLSYQIGKKANLINKKRKAYSIQNADMFAQDCETINIDLETDVVRRRFPP